MGEFSGGETVCIFLYVIKLAFERLIIVVKRQIQVTFFNDFYKF